MPLNLMLCSSRGRGFASVPSVDLGAVAQLARAPALQAGGRGFESHQLHMQDLRNLGSARSGFRGPWLVNRTGSQKVPRLGRHCTAATACPMPRTRGYTPDTGSGVSVCSGRQQPASCASPRTRDLVRPPWPNVVPVGTPPTDTGAKEGLPGQ